LKTFWISNYSTEKETSIAFINQPFFSLFSLLSLKVYDTCPSSFGDVLKIIFPKPQDWVLLPLLFVPDLHCPADTQLNCVEMQESSACQQ